MTYHSVWRAWSSAFLLPWVLLCTRYFRSIFSFATGGIGAVLYNIILQWKRSVAE